MYKLALLLNALSYFALASPRVSPLVAMSFGGPRVQYTVRARRKVDFARQCFLQSSANLPNVVTCIAATLLQQCSNGKASREQQRSVDIDVT